MKVSSTSQITLKYGTTVEELIRLLQTLPPKAKVSVFKDKYYDQRDPGSEGLNFRWDEEL